MPKSVTRTAFTLIELLVVITIIGLLIALLMPGLQSVRRQAKSTICLTRLRTVGQGLVLYALDNKDVFVPGRMPKIDDERWSVKVAGGRKYRPTFLAMMASQVGLPPFTRPLATKAEVDQHGQPGDRQNYSHETYVCPAVSDWTDERNGAYGYNYQFLGNARLYSEDDPTSFKNWTVLHSQVRSPAGCVAVADCIGTAASYVPLDRTPYEDNEHGDSQSGRTPTALGNEGFNLDPPRVDPIYGEMAGFDHQVRTALHERHGRTGNVLWADGHCSNESLATLGYEVSSDSIVTFYGNNRLFSVNQKDEAWLHEE